jgi:hypothetical protein
MKKENYTIAQINLLLFGKREVVGEKISISELMKSGYIKSTDGRGFEFAISVQGGILGVLLSSLASVEIVFGNNTINLEMIGIVLKECIKRMGKLYIHTDKDTLKNLNITEDYLRCPNKKYIESLLVKLLTPSGIGCAYIKSMMQYPEIYSVRSDLVRDVLRAVYLGLWNCEDHNIKLEVFKGKPQEKAILVAKSNTKINRNSILPMISPNNNFFVNYPQVTNFILLEMADLMHSIFWVDKEKFLKVATELFETHLKTTFSMLSGGLPPVFKAIFDEVGDFIRTERYNSLL